jgi:hypothetical protein
MPAVDRARAETARIYPDFNTRLGTSPPLRFSMRLPSCTADSIFVGSFPLGTDFSVWHVGAIWFTIAVVLAPALLAFRVALADQPLFVERLAADA